jgi:hypothetical protein
LHPGAFGERTMRDMVKDTEAAARTLGVQLQLVEVGGPDEFDRAFSTRARQHADVFIVFDSVMLFRERRPLRRSSSGQRMALSKASPHIPVSYGSRCCRAWCGCSWRPSLRRWGAQTALGRRTSRERDRGCGTVGRGVRRFPYPTSPVCQVRLPENAAPTRPRLPPPAPAASTHSCPATG